MNGYECNVVEYFMSWNDCTVLSNEAEPSWMETVQSFNEWNILTSVHE